MWIVVKYKLNSAKIFSSEIKKIFSDFKIFIPKINFLDKNKKLKELNILGNYLFFFNNKLEEKNYVNVLKNIKGVNFILPGALYSQKEIVSFINLCKEHSSGDGFIKSSFFSNFSLKKAKFLNGPFKGMIFSIIKNEKDKLKILINNFLTTVYKNNNNYYFKAL